MSPNLGMGQEATRIAPFPFSLSWEGVHGGWGGVHGVGSAIKDPWLVTV